MTRYIVRRLLSLIPILFGVSIFVFVMMRMVPGDPARQVLGPEATGAEVALLHKQWGLDQPLPVQYVKWLGRVFHGDFGRSIVSKVPVTHEIMNRFPNTLWLTLLAVGVSLLLGPPIGIISAVKANSIVDRLSMMVSLVGVCAPSFWIGLMLLVLFSVKLGWLPSFGKGGFTHLILPAVTLGIEPTAVIARLARSAMLEVFHEDFIRTARAKGLAENVVIVRHALKNALIPIVTVFGLEFGGLLAGAIVTETVFSYPGIGLLMISSINNRDFPVVQAAMLLFSLQFVLVNLIVDVIYARVDPRISYA